MCAKLLRRFFLFVTVAIALAPACSGSGGDDGSPAPDGGTAPETVEDGGSTAADPGDPADPGGPTDPGGGTDGGSTDGGSTDGGGDTTDTGDTGGKTCTPEDVAGKPVSWQVLDVCRAEGELLSVWGSSRNDVFAAGAGGQVLHFDGCTWALLDSGTDADLWWVFGFAGGPVFFSGSGGTLLRYDRATGTFEPMATSSGITIFGISGPAPDDLYAVGFTADNAIPGAVLHYDGTVWAEVSGVPVTPGKIPNYFKVFAPKKDDVWVVGRGDMILHFDGYGWSERPSGLNTDWVTVTGVGTDIVVVGGKSAGTIVQSNGAGWDSVAPEFIQALQGICLRPDGTGLATGVGATFIRRSADHVFEEDLYAPFDLFSPSKPPVAGCQTFMPDYHACWADEVGGFFVVGGNFFAGLTDGAIVYYGPEIPTVGL